MSQVITDTLRSRVACGEKKSMTVWMSSSLPLHPQNSPPMIALLPLLSARSLSLSNRTRTHLARPCGLNWIRYTRLFRHCAVAWESPSHPNENSRQEGHLQHLSVDLRVGVSQRRRGVAGKGRITSLSLYPSLVPSAPLHLTNSGCLLGNFLEFFSICLTASSTCRLSIKPEMMHLEVSSGNSGSKMPLRYNKKYTV